VPRRRRGRKIVLANNGGRYEERKIHQRLCVGGRKTLARAFETRTSRDIENRRRTLAKRKFPLRRPRVDRANGKAPASRVYRRRFVRPRRCSFRWVGAYAEINRWKTSPDRAAARVVHEQVAGLARGQNAHRWRKDRLGRSSTRGVLLFNTTRRCARESIRTAVIVTRAEGDRNG